MSRTKKAPEDQGDARQVMVAVAGRPAPRVAGGALMPRQKRVSLPTTPKKALAEVARVYMEARRGQLHVDDASKLSYVLKNAGDLHRDHVLDRKVDELKAAVERIATILAEKGHAL